MTNSRVTNAEFTTMKRNNNDNNTYQIGIFSDKSKIEDH